MKYLIEGACDGGLFSETIVAIDDADAEDAAIDRLCEAWRVEREPDMELSDLGDAASVTRYGPDDYLRDAAPDLLAFVEQISRMTLTGEADGADLDNDAAMDGLIRRARSLASVARGDNEGTAA